MLKVSCGAFDHTVLQSFFFFQTSPLICYYQADDGIYILQFGRQLLTASVSNVAAKLKKVVSTG